MLIAQFTVPGASEYEQKSRRIDAAHLRAKHEVIPVDETSLRTTAADIVHVYGSPLPVRSFLRFGIPYVASAGVPASRFSFRKPVPPRYVLSPIVPMDPESGLQLLPEAVEEEWFERVDQQPRSDDVRVIGSYGPHRKGVMNAIEQALARVHRFREDIVWTVFERIPSPADLSAVDLWVDPAVEDDDMDGFTAEAIVAGKPLVSSRTPINVQRLEKGRTGFLVPGNDPNELTHAILAALFKPEVATVKIEAARQTAAKFRPRQRIRVLERIYETLVQ